MLLSACQLSGLRFVVSKMASGSAGRQGPSRIEQDTMKVALLEEAHIVCSMLLHMAATWPGDCGVSECPVTAGSKDEAAQNELTLSERAHFFRSMLLSMSVVWPAFCGVQVCICQRRQAGGQAGLSGTE